jgi:hypothetical protein
MHLQAMMNEIPDLADQLAASIEQMADHGELHALASKRWFHNGRSLRAQIRVQARCRNAMRMSARRS